VLGSQGGGVPSEFAALGTGTTLTRWLPTGLIVVVLVAACVWVLDWWRKAQVPGAGSEPGGQPGVQLARDRIRVFALAGGLAAFGGLALTATTGFGDALAGDRLGYTLASIAAVVLGGCSLYGGRGGLLGPVAAAVALTLVQTILVLEGAGRLWARLVETAIMLLVIVLGGLAARRRRSPA
jgi:ribose transport system permease protein